MVREGVVNAHPTLATVEAARVRGVPVDSVDVVQQIHAACRVAQIPCAAATSDNIAYALEWGLALDVRFVLRCKRANILMILRGALCSGHEIQ